MSAAASSYDAYKRIDVETASQGKLIVMLFNGAIQRAEEAKRQMDRGDLEKVHANLLRAQDIMAELRGALNMEAGEIAENLDRIYEYFHHLLVQANIRKAKKPIDECVGFMTTMRDTWETLFQDLAKDEPPPPPPTINPHGSSVMNIQG